MRKKGPSQLGNKKPGNSKRGTRIPSSFPTHTPPKSFPPVDDFCSDGQEVQRSNISGRRAPVGPIDPNKVLPELLGRGRVSTEKPDIGNQVDGGPRHRVIIGPSDDRKPVSNTRIPPYCAICSLEINFPSGPSEIGTGWLVDSRLVVTAGHCVFNKGKGGFAKEIVVSPGRNGASHWQVQTVTATGGRFRTTPEHGSADEPNPDFDYGAIILPQPFANIGNLGFDNYDDNKLSQETFNAVGYPQDKPVGTMWGHAKRLEHVRRRRLEYQIDTEGGQSGSPVFDFVQENGQTLYIAVGIHNAGSKSQQINIAARINDDVHTRIQRWIRLSQDQE